MGATNNSISIAIVGSGGAGTLTAGEILLEAAARAGWYGLLARSVGPQIRGGEAAALLRLATRPVACMDDRFDVLIGIDWNNAGRFAAEIVLTQDSLIIGDEDGEVPEAMAASGARRIEIPFKELAKQIADGRANMLALGVALGLLNLPYEVAAGVLRGRLADKGPAAIVAGLAAIGRGIEAAANLAFPTPMPPAAPANGGRWLLTGNEAAGLGAVEGGIRFAAAYPITPATELLEWLSSALPRVGGVLVQAEDELASINMAIGASFGGTPSLTATSGPGLALMIESLGLAVASETPVVVVDVMRGGPSTGIPTKSEQADLNIAVYGCHGDAPHPVVAPLSASDCVSTTAWAVHLAEALQAPTIVLSDQLMAQMRVAVDRPPEPATSAARTTAADAPDGYRRYRLTGDGVSPMAIPGAAGRQYTADGLTHDERGIPSSRAEDHLRQLDKRRDKLERFDYGELWADVEGDGEVALVTWGSSTGASREAIARCAAAGLGVRLIALRLISPLPVRRLQQALTGAGQTLVVEQSHSAQFYRHLRSQLDLAGEVRVYHRPGPLPMRPGEIFDQLMQWRR